MPKSPKPKTRRRATVAAVAPPQPVPARNRRKPRVDAALNRDAVAEAWLLATQEAHPMPVFTASHRQLIRDGTKTQTRRVARPQPPRHNPEPPLLPELATLWPPQRSGLACPYGRKTGLHYLREPLKKVVITDKFGKRRSVAAYSDDGELVLAGGIATVKWTWKNKSLPAMFMPRYAARVFCTVTGRRGEWLHEITDKDAKAEGVPQGGYITHTYANYEDIQEQQPDGSILVTRRVLPPKPFSYRDSYATIWNSINAKPRGKRPGWPWQANPFVWVISWTLARPPATVTKP